MVINLVKIELFHEMPYSILRRYYYCNYYK